MGQTNLQKIQQSLIQLTQRQQIQNEQAQNLLRDYISSGQEINDINFYIKEQPIDLFLKYFIKSNYVSKPAGQEDNSNIMSKSKKDRKNQSVDYSSNITNTNSKRISRDNKQESHQMKIIKNSCQEIHDKWNYFINELKSVSMSNDNPVTAIRQNIKDILISHLQIQSYRYYCFKNGMMKQTNSKILYLYDTCTPNTLFQYAKQKNKSYQQLPCLQNKHKQNERMALKQMKMNNINSSGIANKHTTQCKTKPEQSSLQQIFKQAYPSSEYCCYQFYNKKDKSLHMLVVQISLQLHKWKYGKSFIKCPNSKNYSMLNKQAINRIQIKQIIMSIFQTLIQNNGFNIIYNSEQVQGIHISQYKLLFTKFIVNFMQCYLHLQSRRVYSLLSQYDKNTNSSKFTSLIQKKLTKLRRFKSQIYLGTIEQSSQSSRKLRMYMSFNCKRQLQFFFTNYASVQKLNSKISCDIKCNYLIEKIKNFNNQSIILCAGEHQNCKQQNTSLCLDLENCLQYLFKQQESKTSKKVIKFYNKAEQNCTMHINQNASIFVNKKFEDEQSNGLQLIVQCQVTFTKQFNKGDENTIDKQNQYIMRYKKQQANVGENGWFKVFLNKQSKGISNDVQPVQMKSSRKNQIKLPKINRSYNNSSFINLYSISDLQKDIDVDTQSINLLDFSSCQLEVFTLKLFSKLPYFCRLVHENDQFPNFLRQIHNDYQKNKNKFHNFTHAVNVMHTCYLFIKSQKNQQILSQFQQFIIVFSGLCHDVGHTGFTNLFQIARESSIAITYNNKSPLENYHASRTFSLLKKPENNFLNSLNQKQFSYLRQLAISSILFTDIKEHFNLLKNFESKKLSIKKSENVLIKNDQINLLAGMIVHASDFAGSVKQFRVCKAWSLLVNQQFTKQYKEQGRLGLPQTPFMKDLDNLGVLAKNQLGFLKVIVQPLYKQITTFCHDRILNILLKNVEDNIGQWSKIMQQQQMKKVKKQTNN